MGWGAGLADSLFAVRRAGSGRLSRGYEFATSVNTDTGGEFVSPIGERGNPFAGDPSLPRLRPVAGQGEFATSVNTDTAGEFPSAADRPESGQAGSPRQAESWVPVDPDEFASSISVGFGPKR